MLDRLLAFALSARDQRRMAIALARGGATLAARRVDLTRPGTWEASGFSQNGEDGVLEVLRGQLADGHRTFVEIGASDGLENNTAWLAVAERYAGLMVEGDRRLATRAARNIRPQSIGAEVLSLFVTRASVPELRARALQADPDVFSLDIDGNDLHVAEALLDGGFRPAIFVVEYNATFGPERSVTVPYQEDFVFTAAHPSALWYGASITAWRRFFGPRGYRFVTVERNGVNAFFVDEARFPRAFLDGVRGLPFAENRYHRRLTGLPWERQLALIADQPLVTI